MVAVHFFSRDNGKSINQEYSIPKPMLNYCIQNWTPIVYQKLIKTCKLFFDKTRAIVINGSDTYEKKAERLNKWKEQIFENYSKNIPYNIKLWFIGNASFYSFDEDCYRSIKNKIYQCDFDKFDKYEEHIVIEDFAVMAANIKRISLASVAFCTTVKKAPETKMYGCPLYECDCTIGDILALAPKVEYFS
uniref:Uncharacterized protein n=1 Tax=Panagrolaimus davidi TaxID=227884 RepID=A0A914Q8J7_9BILA